MDQLTKTFLISLAVGAALYPVIQLGNLISTKVEMARLELVHYKRVNGI